MSSGNPTLRNFNSFFRCQPLLLENEASDLMSLDIVSKRASSGSINDKLAAVRLVRALYNHDVTPPISDLKSSGLLSMMVDYLGDHDSKCLQCETIWTLSDIAYGSSEQVKAIVDAGALPHLIRLLRSPDQNVCDQAVWALGNIVGDTAAMRDHVASFGLIPELVSLLRPGLPFTLLRSISWVLVNFCRCRETPPPGVSAIPLLPVLSVLIHHEDIEVAMHTAWAVSYLAESGAEMIRMMVQFNILNNLATLLSHTDVRMQAATLKIAEFVAQAGNLSPSVLNEDVVQLVIEHMKSSCRSISEHAIRAINSLIIHVPRFICASIRLGIVPALLLLIHQGVSSNVLGNVTHTMMNICRNRRTLTPLEIIALSELLPPLQYMLRTTCTSILNDVAWALAYISESGSQMVQMMIDCKVLSSVLPLMVHTDTNIQMAALRVIGNAAAGSEVQTEAVIREGALKHFPSLLIQPNKAINKEALRILSNVAAGKDRHIQAMIDAGLIPMVINYVDRYDYETQREAIWTVGNITECGNEKQINYLIRKGVIPSLCKSLVFIDTEILKIILISIRNMLEKASRRDVITIELEKCGGLDKIELLQRHKNVDIYNVALWIITQYFPS